MKDVHLEIDRSGFGKTIVGGVDISNQVTGIAVWIEPGEPTRVEVRVVGDVSLDAKEADVTLVRSA